MSDPTIDPESVPDDVTAAEERALAAYYIHERLLLSVHDAFSPLSRPVPPEVFRALDRATDELRRRR